MARRWLLLLRGPTKKKRVLTHVMLDRAPRAPPIGCARQPHDDAISDAGSALENFVYALRRALSSSSASREAQRFASTDIKLGSNLIDVELGRKQKWVHVRAICRKGKVKLMGGSSRNGSDMPI